MNKRIIYALGVALALFSACQKGNTDSADPESTETYQKMVTVEPEPHPYGGWYCPDNLRGFPAVNLNDWNQVPVVQDRLPTQEEARNGTSLIYVDPEKYPNARAMDMPLPQLARYYNRYSGRSEWIIVIQAVIINQDSILGFRYANGGNGSARFREVEFLSPKEREHLPEDRFVVINDTMDALPSEFFRILSDSIYDLRLKEEFGEKVFKEAGWSANPRIYRSSGKDTVQVGQVNAYWPDGYIQVDFQIDGKPYTDKILLSKLENENRTALFLVSGPYGEDYDRQKQGWERWLSKIKEPYDSKYFMPGGK